MKNILEVVNLSAEFLKKRGIQRSKREAEWLIAHALKCSRMDLYLQFDRPLLESEMEPCRDVIRRRSLGEPYEYIVGSRTFDLIKLEIDRSVLIPRNETEMLAVNISQLLQHENVAGKTLLDLCTGSGALAISLKKRFPALSVVASDLSASALAMAKKNSELNNVEITFFQGDLFAPLEGMQFDYFVSNPPYIAESEWEALPRDVKEFEPKMALVGGSDGLDFYRSIATRLTRFLKKGGKGWLEMGENQGERVKSLFQGAGFEAHVEKDFLGKERFIHLLLP